MHVCVFVTACINYNDSAHCFFVVTACIMIVQGFLVTACIMIVQVYIFCDSLYNDIARFLFLFFVMACVMIVQGFLATACVMVVQVFLCV